MPDYTSAIDGITQDQLTCCSSSGLYPRDRAELVIHEDASVSVRIRREYVATSWPMAEWHGRTIVVSIADNARLTDLEYDLGSEGVASMLIDAVIAGHTVVWDGSNHVGQLTEQASAALWELHQGLGNLPSYELAADDAE